MEKTYRTLLLKYDLNLLLEKVSALLKVQEEFRRWAAEWVKSGGSLPLPQHNPLKYFATEFIYAGRMLEKKVEVKKMRAPLFFNAQLRLENELDKGSGIFVDIPRREVRIRKWSNQRGNTIVLPLGDKAVKWILERVQEGGRLVLAAVWIGRSRRNHAAKLYVALIFRRDAEKSVEVKRLLAVDFNALHNGLSWAVVDGEKIVAEGIMRPDVSKIIHLEEAASKLDSLCAKEDKACEEATAAKRRIWRLLRSWEDAAAKKLMQLALQYKAAIVVDVPRDSSIRRLKEGGGRAERKIFLNFGRLRRRLQGLAEWYGVPLREERLYSTICPRCGAKMTVLPNRRVKCTCGFEAHRDEVPALWAVILFHKLISFSSSPFSEEFVGGKAAAGSCSPRL
jgi:putative transposase